MHEDDWIFVDRTEFAMIKRAVAILEKGGDVRGGFLHEATELLVDAGMRIGSDRFVYKDGVRRFSPAQWDVLCQATHAATFACLARDLIGRQAQDHVDSWLLDAAPVLRKLINGVDRECIPEDELS